MSVLHLQMDAEHCPDAWVDDWKYVQFSAMVDPHPKVTGEKCLSWIKVTIFF